MPLPDRFLTSLYIHSDGRAILIDCGEGTQTAIRVAGLRFKCIEAVLLTHFHADHVSGLPGLLLTLGNEERTEPLYIYGPVGLKRVIAGMRVIVPELPYEIICEELSAEGMEFSAAGLNVCAFPADHGMACFGYCVSLSRAGRFSPERAREKQIPVRLWSRLQSGESVDGFVPEDVLGAPRRGLKVLYATDTRPVDGIVKYGADADLMILEGMFGAPEKDERAEKTHHMTMREAVSLGCEAKARRLWLTHFSPATPHPEEFLEEMSAIYPGVIMGETGLSVVLRFDESDEKVGE